MRRWRYLSLSFLLLVTVSVRAGENSLTSLAKVQQAYERGEIDLQTSIIYRLYAIKDYSRLPSRFKSPVSTRCPTSELLLIRRDWPLLSQEVRLQLKPLLQRPTLSGPEHLYDTAHFKIHWTDTGTDSTDTTYVDSLASFAEYSWEEEVDTLAWDEPPPDGAGGDDKYDIYVKDNGGAGWAGYCQTEAPGPDPDQEDATSFIVMENSLTNNQLKTTTAHEFNHACQFSYSYAELTSWYENTAVWMEDVVYDDINGYYWFLGSGQENPLTRPEWSITYFSSGSTYPYGACIWPKYMDQRNSDPDLPRKIWDLNGTHWGTYTVQDIDSVLTQDYGSSFEEALKEYSVWRYFTGSNDDGNHYEEGASWTDPYVAAEHTHSSYPASGDEGARPPDYYGTNFIELDTTGEQGGLKMTFDGEDAASWAAMVVSFDTLPGSIVQEMNLDTSDSGTIFVKWDGYMRIVLIPVVLSSWGTDLTYTYSAEFVPADSLPPEVMVAQPNGGEAWSIAEVETIRWVATDSAFVDHIDILYSTDAGSSWDTVSANEMNDSSYAWTIPNTPSDNCLVQIAAHDPWDNDTFDISDSLFSIGDFTPPQVLVVTPNGGEDWAIGEIDTIRWIATDLFGIDSLTIFYSTDGGSGWDTVSSGEPNDSGYSWVVPDTPSDSCLVRIVAYDPSLNSAQDLSDSLFRISDRTPPLVQVVVPNGGENWAVGEQDTIRWIADDQYGVDSVDIHYSTDAGTSWDTISAGEANDSSYFWVIPPTPSESCLVRIVAYDPNLNSGEDVSDSLFIISDQASPQVTVVVPNGGEDWSVGEEDTIRWIALDNVGVDHLDIYYSTNGGTYWDTVSVGEANDSSYSWTIPPPLSDSCLVRIIAYDQSLNPGEDVSDSLFTISDRTPPQVTVLVPNGGEDWAIGATDTVRWIATDMFGIDSLGIYYSTDGGTSWDTVSTGEPNDSNYAWTIPDTPSDSCLVRILAYDPSQNLGADLSDSLFRISDQTPPRVTVIAPNGGENWVVDEEDTVRWTAYDEYGVDSVNICYSVNGGSRWDTVSTGEPNDSSYTWTVPPTPSDSCLVKIVAYDSYLNPGEDESDSLFTISDQTPPEVTVLVPNGGESWAVGEEDTIRWMASDNVAVDHLDIYYSTDAGSNWDTVSVGEVNDSLYVWMVPSTPSDSCLVRVIAHDPYLNQSEDESDSLFTIYVVGLEEISSELPLPRTFGLSQSFPNPFSYSTSIRYQVPVDGLPRTAVSLAIYDLSGRLVRTLVDTEQGPGYYVVRWDGKDASGYAVASGLYFYRLSARRHGGSLPEADAAPEQASGGQTRPVRDGQSDSYTAFRKMLYLR